MAYSSSYPLDTAYVKDIPAAIRLKGEQLKGTADGPLVDADKTDGYHASPTPMADAIVVSGAGGKVAAGYLDLTGYVPTTRELAAGGGMSASGLGSLAADKTINMATPGTITINSANAVPQGGGHTHALTLPIMGYFGTDLTEHSTMSTSYVTAKAFTFTVPIAGVYTIRSWCALKINSTQPASARIIFTADGYVFGTGSSTYTGPDKLCTSPTYEHFILSDVSAYFTEGVKTFTVQYKSGQSNAGAYIDTICLQIFGSNTVG